MAASTAVLRIKVGADILQFTKSIETVKQKVAAVAKDMQKVGKSMSTYVSAPLAAMAAMSIKMYDTQARSEAKVQQAIKSTAGAARLSFDQLKNFASELQGKTVFGDEEILNKSTAQLLTFTNLAGENFKRAQMAALDLSTVLDGDLQSASMQLGKALNDPVRSLSALRKSGIQFSSEQEAVIKKLAQTGQIAKAQSMMLDELERQYGGQAEARAKEGAGSLLQLKNSWGDFMEQIGKAIMPIVNALSASLRGMVDWLNSLSPATMNAIVSVSAFVAAVGPAIFIVAKLISVIKSLTIALSGNIVAIAITAFVALGAALIGVIGYTRETTRVMGANEKAVSEETKRVNILTAKLLSANIAEKDRKKAISELVKINPSIVSGINQEAAGYETLRKNLRKFNEEQVRKLALAKLTDKEGSLLGDLGNIEASKIEATEGALTKIYEIGEKIKSGEIKGFEGSTHFIDNLLGSSKLSDYEKIVAFGKNLKLSNSPYRDVNQFIDYKNTLLELQGKTKPIQTELETLQKTIEKTEKGVSAQLKTALGGEGEIDETTKQINDLNTQIKELQTVRQSTGDNVVIAAIDSQISTLQTKVKALNTTPIVDEKATGIVARLADEIERLEKAKANAKTIEEVGAINSQIEVLKKQIDGLSSVTSEYLALRAKMGERTPITGGLSIIIPTIKATLTPVKLNADAVFEDIKRQLNEKFKELANTNFAQYATQKIATSLSKHGVDAARSMGEQMLVVADTIQQKAQELAGIMANGMSDMFVSLGEAIGGGGNIGEALQNSLASILGSIGKFLVDLGMQTIIMGTVMKGFQEAMKFLVENPLIAIAAGAAMVALGVVLSSSLKKKAESSAPKLANGGLAYGPTYAMVGDNVGARVDPEVIAPLSKLKGIMGTAGSGNINLTVSGKLTATGRDLALVLSKENYKLQVMGC